MTIFDIHDNFEEKLKLYGYPKKAAKVWRYKEFIAVIHERCTTFDVHNPYVIIPMDILDIYIKNEDVKRKFMSVSCHGGITYNGYMSLEPYEYEYAIGYDYLSMNDYSLTTPFGRVHPIEEIITELEYVIDQLSDIINEYKRENGNGGN